MGSLSDKIEENNEEYSNMRGSYSYVENFIYAQDVKEFIRDIPMGIKKCIERGQFNERYFENWLKERAGDKLT